MAESRCIDLAFFLAGDTLPADYPLALLDSVARHLPWVADEPQFGIHPVRAATTENGVVMLNRRSRLVVRVPTSRLADVEALSGTALTIAGSQFSIGASTRRPLVANATQHAAFVVLDTADETLFMERAAQQLESLGIRSPMVCGRPRSLLSHQGQLPAFSLLVHGLTRSQSLLLQDVGLGSGRALGAGLFLPHKSVSSVIDD